jgi:translation initiation factor 5A
MASLTPIVADEEQVPPVDSASSSEESDKEPVSRMSWSRRVAAGVAACTATYAVGRAAMHGLATDGGVAPVAESNGVAPKHPPVLGGMIEMDSDACSHTYPRKAGELKKGSHVMLKGNPCKIVHISTSKSGKQGYAKALIVGLDIFTGKKYEDVIPASHNVEVPVVERVEYQALTVDSDTGKVSLLTESGDTKDDLTLPNVLGKAGPSTPDQQADDEKLSTELSEETEKDEKKVLATVQNACGMEKIVGVKLTTG